MHRDLVQDFSLEGRIDEPRRQAFLENMARTIALGITGQMLRSMKE